MKGARGVEIGVLSLLLAHFHSFVACAIVCVCARVCMWKFICMYICMHVYVHMFVHYVYSNWCCCLEDKLSCYLPIISLFVSPIPVAALFLRLLSMTASLSLTFALLG